MQSINYLGSIRQVIHKTADYGNSNITGARDYYPYGRILRETNNAEEERFKFTEKERDKETDFDYFGARYYDSGISRWTTVDPLADKYYGWSPYAYTLCNPLNSFDPDGKFGDPFSLTFYAASAVALGVGITIAATYQATRTSYKNYGRMPTQLEVELTATKMLLDVANEVSEFFSSAETNVSGKRLLLVTAECFVRRRKKQLDTETNLHYFRARYYDDIDCWTTVDPLADLFPGQSPYGYATDTH